MNVIANCNEINMVLNLRPAAENAKFPCKANAVGMEVTYMLGYIPATRPMMIEINPLNIISELWEDNLNVISEIP